MFPLFFHSATVSSQLSTPTGMAIKCPVCNQEFSGPGYLERHIAQKMDSVHQQERLRQRKAQVDRIAETIQRVEAQAHSRLASHAERQPIQQPNDDLQLGSNEAIQVAYNTNDQEEYEDEDNPEDEDRHSNFGLDPGYGDETDSDDENSDIEDNMSDCPSLLLVSDDEFDQGGMFSFIFNLKSCSCATTNQ